MILIQESAEVYFSKLHFQRLVPIGTFMLTVKMFVFRDLPFSIGTKESIKDEYAEFCERKHILS